jgi:prepilin signal peptidase PulO-like enzyme (type II secretory pathway)
MSVIIMCLLAIPVGWLLDSWIARLALEPYLSEDDDEPGDLLQGEAAAIAVAPTPRDGDIPRALTTMSTARRVVVIAATVVLFSLVGLQYQAETLSMAIVTLYVAALIVCTGTDVLAYRVPNVVTYPSILGAIVVGMVMPDASRADVWLGGLITGGTFLAMSIATRGGMGMGDVKLALFIGLALGLALGIMSLLITAIAGGVIAVLLMVTGIRSRRDPIPYAPFLAMGTLFVLLVHGAAFTSI